MFHSPFRPVQATAWVWSVVAACVAQAAGPSEALLPSSTKGYVSVPRVPVLVESWSKTQVGRLLADPVMQPFADDLRRQIKEKWARGHDKLGLSVEDVQGLASGELALALVRATDGKGALAMLVDITGNEEEAQRALDKVADTLHQRGAARKEQEFAGTTLTVFSREPKGEAEEERQLVHFIKDGLLVTSDHLGVAADILNRMGGPQPDSLASLEPYQKVMERCRSHAGALEPHVRWFVEPIGLAEAVRSSVGDRPRKDKDYLGALKNQGFGAVQGIGGFVNFAVDRYGLLHRTAVYAPPPYNLAMRMLVFPNGDDFSPQAWVPRDIATYATFQCDLQNAFERASTLVDELAGDEGVFEDTIRCVIDDPYGPKVDIRNDLVAHLSQRTTILTDYKLPITPTSQRRLLAIETANPHALAAAVARSLKNDPQVIERKVHEHLVWEITPEAAAVPVIQIQNPGGAAGPVGAAANQGGQLPKSAVAIAHGHIFVSSDVDLLEKILAELDERERLDGDMDYRLVVAEFDKLGVAKSCARDFSRMDEQFRSTYEMFRQGKLPESDTLFAQLLNVVLGEDKEGIVRQPQLDGSKLPDYQIVRRYLGPAGTAVASEDNGWFIVGFTLSKDTPLANEPAPPDTTSR